MGALVLELQRLAQSSDVRLPELMRRAKTVAFKLARQDAHDWIEHEIGGYAADVDLPPYRIISCQLRVSNKFNPWQPLRWEHADEITELLNTWHVREPISHVQSASDGEGMAVSHLSQAELDALRPFFGDQLRYVQVARFFDRAAFTNILDSVRDKVLTWALALEEKGVLGHDMTFEDKEKREAAQVVFHVKSVGTLVQGDHVNAPSAVHSPGASVALASALDSPGAVVNASTSSIDQRIGHAVERLRDRDEAFAQTAEKLATAIWTDGTLTDEQKQESMEALMWLLEETGKPKDQRQPKGALKALVCGLRETLGVSADVAQLATAFYPPLLTLLAIGS
jgi:hypothetical protein